MCQVIVCNEGPYSWIGKLLPRLRLPTDNAIFVNSFVNLVVRLLLAKRDEEHVVIQSAYAPRGSDLLNGPHFFAHAVQKKEKRNVCCTANGVPLENHWRLLSPEEDKMMLPGRSLVIETHSSPFVPEFRFCRFRRRFVHRHLV
jgi:hypothetical protein